MKIKQVQHAPPLLKTKRVAAYARVSAGSEAMLHSMSAQVSYYSEYISKNPDWEFGGVFVDEAITGTKDNRPGFQKMLSEARAGNISLIITKSISRFARNTVTVLESVRELKRLGVDVFFEEQNIHSLSAEGELMLSILASYAQEESRSASENCKWRIQKNFKEGKDNFGMRVLGYHCVDGVVKIVPEEAEIVQAIFADYLSGMGLTAISKKCGKQGFKISTAGVSSVIRNEKYTGDMLLQKYFLSDHISKRKIKNTGQLPQYYVQDHHEAIISKDMFEAVQSEIKRRSDNHNPKRKPPEKGYTFTGLIRCGICGANYQRRYIHIGTKYEKPVWICMIKNRHGNEHCDSKAIPEDILIEKSMEVLSLETLCETTLRTCINQIRVPEQYSLTFVFADEHEVSVNWEQRHRGSSWTPAMKNAARQRKLEWYEKRKEMDSGEQEN